MITKIVEYSNKQIPSSDLCIVGCGPAGMELARNFAGTSSSITVIESGYEHFDWRIQRLSRFKQAGHPVRSADYSKPFGLEEAKKQECHLRKFGGTMCIWGGRWKALDPTDLAEKPYLKESGWPVSYDTLHTYYREAAAAYDVKELLHLLEQPVNLPLLPYQHTGISSSIDIKHNPPMDFIKGFHELAERSSNIRLILGGTATEIRLSDDSQHVRELIVRSLEGGEWRVKSNQFVLACSAIETARLLLASNKQIKAGIGNESGLVGRNLLDHPHAHAGVLVPLQPQKPIVESALYNVGGKLICFGISMHPKQLMEENLPNHCINILSRTPGSHNYPVKYQLEQLPNFESRVFLTDECDELGMPVACVDWKFREEDKTCLRRFTEKMNSLLTSQKIGFLKIDEGLYDMKSFADHAHQMGTTRMASNPQEGVVDINCQVFGIDNLFIAGTSVFPAAGNANPTFTLLALARRLSDHLKGKQ